MHFTVAFSGNAGTPGEKFSRRDGERRRFGGRAASARALEPFTAPACVERSVRAHIISVFRNATGNKTSYVYGLAAVSVILKTEKMTVPMEGSI